MEKIVSLQNARIKKWTSLHQKKYRDQYGLFLVEGSHLISEAKKAGCLDTVISDQEYTDFDKCYQTTPAIMKKLSQNVSEAHIIGVCRKMNAEPADSKRLLLLDGIQDPGNLGTLIRTAVSFSFDGIYCSENTCDPYNDKTIRSTQGALFHIPVVFTNLNALVSSLQKNKVTVVATTLEDAVSIDQIPPAEKMAFILGNEGQGVSSDLQKEADQRLRIDMHGFESLNVAVAGGIIMYSYRKKG